MKLKQCSFINEINIEFYVYPTKITNKEIEIIYKLSNITDGATVLPVSKLQEYDKPFSYILIKMYGSTIGFIRFLPVVEQFTQSKDAYFELNNIVILKEFQSKGLGTQMMLSLINFFISYKMNNPRLATCNKISLFCNKNSNKLVSFYQKLGFIIKGNTYNSGMACYIMEKNLLL